MPRAGAALESGAGRARFFATEAGNTDITIPDMLAVLREAGTLPENLSRPVRNGTAAAPLPGRRVLAPLV